jgi:hypothetical protein
MTHEPRKTPPFCAWCGERLDEQTWFQFEMELAAFEQNAPLIDSKAGEVQPLGDRPLPICAECRESLHQNAAELREERDAPRTTERRAVRIAGFLVVGFILLIALMMFWRVIEARSRAPQPSNATRAVIDAAPAVTRRSGSRTDTV